MTLRRGMWAAWTALVMLAGAAPSRSVAQQAMPPQAGDVDLVGSRVYVFVGKTGLGHDHAVIGMLQSGRVRLGAAEQAGRLVFDVRSFRADTTEARKALGLAGETDPGTQKQVTDNMLGPDVLDAARHPAASFEIRSALQAARPAAAGRTAFDLVGTFTLHGVTRPIVVPVEVEPLGQRLVRLTGGFMIKQTDFGMKPYTKLGGVVGVADQLKIYGDVRLLAAAGGPAGPAAGPTPAATPNAVSPTSPGGRPQ